MRQNEKMKSFAKDLRINMTKEEKHLWFDFLSLLPVTVNRQRIIGPYIVDFYCAKAKLVIELDGSQHSEQEGYESDLVRDRYFSGLGMSVLRFTNQQINTCFDWVCDTIRDRLKLA